MKKIIKIGMILIVLLGMVGSANATTTMSPNSFDLNVYTDEVKHILVTHYSDEPYPTSAEFEIEYSGGISTELVGTWNNSDWTATGAVAPHYYGTGVDPYGNTVNMTTWDFYITDSSDDTDDDAQNGKTYKVEFYINGVYAGGTYVDGSTTFVNAVPEFPTIALPVAAILGLAFIFQRRREED